MSSQDYHIKVDQSNAIELFFSNKIILNDSWPDTQAQDFLNLIKKLSYEDILRITDSFDYSQPLDSNFVPQFADMEAVDNATLAIGNSGKPVLNYEELGYFLIRENRKIGAYRKYGENHGKGASLLGLALYQPGKFSKSCLTDAFNHLQSNDEKSAIRTRLFLRIPFIQKALYCAKNERFNAYDLIRMFTIETMERRGQSPRKIFKELQKCNCLELNRRINNIYWDT